MGIAVMEETVRTIGAILKTLECPICLELLKTPVSAGCGHFFCRGCITETLDTKYRAPCPLCKRSFTRRSIQEAPQRQAVILAAKALSKTCSNLTGVDFIPTENTSKLSKKNPESHLPSAKKLKVTPKEKRDGASKKRKSCENEGSISQSDVNDSNSKIQNPENQNGNNSDISNECASAKKRVCYESDQEDDLDDLPSLEEIFLEREPLTKAAKASTFDKLLLEKPLSIIPTEKVSKLKTYSNCRKKSENKPKTSEELNSNTENVLHTESLLNERNENELSNISNEESTQIKIKNKINALKNKTNDHESDKYVLQEDCFLSKVKDCKNDRKNKITEAKQETESKENELFSSAAVLPNQSPLKASNSKKGRRKSNKRNQQLSTHTISSTLPESKNLRSSSMKCEVSTKKTSIVKDKGGSDSKCYTLDETPISPHSVRKENSERKLVDDPLGLIDTAVSVDAVKSPLTGKAISLKSPGWSRVKKGKKDFKLKKFSALQIEKNPSFLSHKQGRSSLDSVGSEQGTVSPGLNKSDQLPDEIENKKTDQDQSTFDNNVDRHNGNVEVSLKNQSNPEELDLLNLNKDQIQVSSSNKDFSENDGYCKDENEQKRKLFGETNVDLEGKDGLTVQEEICEEMDCSDAPTNGSHGFNVNNEENALSIPNADVQDFSVKNSNTDAGDPKASHANIITNKRLSSKSNVHTNFTQIIEDEASLNLRNSEQDLENLQNANELRENSSLNTSLNEGKGIISKKEKVISKHSYVVYDDCSESNKDESCSNNITPKRKKTLTLKTQIEEYQRFQTQSLLNEDEGLHYVEHSQQTSQMAFNFDHQNPVYNNLALMPQQSTHYLPQQYPLPCANPSAGKTKVVKRTCLTLEEIQDYFYKSNMNNSSEKICSFPFLSGLFMLDICVSEETLNVSVLRVMDQTSESNVTSLYPVPEFSDKGIQSSNSLFNVPSPVFHSSNSSDPNCITEPFPYLNKLSHDVKESRSSSKSAEEAVDNIVEQSLKENDTLKISEVQGNLNEDIREDCDMSEIIHFPKEHIQQDNHALQNNICVETDHYQNTNEESQRSQENAEAATAPFLLKESETEIGLHSSQKDDSKEKFDDNKQNDISPHEKDKSSDFQAVASDDFSDSDKEASLLKLQQYANKEITKGRKLSRLSLKKKSKFRRTQICDSSDESDVEQNSIKTVSKENVTAAMLENPTEITPNKKSPAFKEPSCTIGLENTGNSLAPPELEMPCTLNSVLSEDIPEANASEIIMEIEDLSDKIKFLEEKLKQCGHVDEQKSVNVVPKERKPHSGDSSLLHGSDSEDSNDLFPHSVPPTPPEKCGLEANSSYKSSFYKTC